jgi:hypothetical protein
VLDKLRKQVAVDFEQLDKLIETPATLWIIVPITRPREIELPAVSTKREE